MVLQSVRMCRIDGIVLEDHKSRVIKELHRKGVSEIEFLEDEYLNERGLERDRPVVEVMEISDLLLKVGRIIEILQRFDKSSVSFLEDMLGVEGIKKMKVADLDYDDLVKQSKDIIRAIEDDVTRYDRLIPELESREVELVDRIETYERFRGLDLNLDLLGESRYLYVAMGLIRANRIGLLRDGLSKRFGEEYILLEGEGEKGSIPLVVCVPKEKTGELTTFMRELNFDQVSVKGGGRVSGLLKNLKNELHAVKKEKDEAIERLRGIYQEFYQRILVIEELLQLEKRRNEIFTMCGRTRKTVIMRLWMPDRDCEAVADTIKKETEEVCILNIERNPDDAPILLENPKPLNSFEMLTRLFSLPRYKEIDPTLVLVPTFCLFFGIMLTDAVYGVILILVSLWIRRKYGQLSKTALDLSTIFTGGGIGAVILGVLTGSYLGDFLGKYILGRSSQDIALWIDPMNDGNAMTFLIAVCILGFIHLYAGHILGAYDRLRNGRVKEALQENISWYILFFGFLMAIATYFNLFPLPEFIGWIGILFVLVAFALLYSCYGFLFFTNIIGVVGNTLSYARLLAMALTTAGIAMSFNFLASMAMDIPLIGVFVAGLVFISGHIINILINSLGAFVHTLRLHYVEHFGTYYVGGGRPFHPFKEERRYSY